MSPIAEEIYTSIIQILSPIDRLQLARLILNVLKQNVSVIDISDEWTEQDRSDITDQQQGLRIGSGAVESTIKRIGVRIKISGAQWKAENVGRVLKQRCAYLNRFSV